MSDMWKPGEEVLTPAGDHRRLPRQVMPVLKKKNVLALDKII